MHPRSTRIRPLPALLFLVLILVLQACAGDSEPAVRATTEEPAVRLVTAEELGDDWVQAPKPGDGAIKTGKWGPHATGSCAGVRPPKTQSKPPWEAFRRFEMARPPMLEMPAGEEPVPVQIWLEEALAVGPAARMRELFDEYAAGMQACWGKSPFDPYAGTFTPLRLSLPGEASIGTDVTYRPTDGSPFFFTQRRVVILDGELLMAVEVFELPPPYRRWRLDRHLDNTTLERIIEQMLDQAT